jgi:glycosyltransferase involved in cell wall biosynthesis
MTSLSRRDLAVLAPSAYPVGGVQSWLDYLVPGLEARGWRVTVMLVDGARSSAGEYLRHRSFSNVRLVTNRSGSREGRVRALMRAIGSVDPALLLVVNIVDAYEAVRRMRSGGSSLRIAMSMHGFESCFYEDLANFRNVIDGVVTPNRLAAAAAARISGISEARACYAPCGVPVPALKEPTSLDETLLLLYAGRFDEQEKRVLDLPHILEELDRLRVPYRLRLAGLGPAEQALRSRLAAFGDKVEFVGVLEPERLRSSFYQPGAILVVMSPSETGPMVAWEAMANGVAVVTSRFIGIGMEDGLRDGQNCLVFPVGDARRAAAAIAQLANASLRVALIRSAWELVSLRYSREQSISAWDAALTRVMTLPALPPAASSARERPAGRLDKVFGKAMAETLRGFIGVRYAHLTAGSEWPHSYGAMQPRLSPELAAMDGQANSLMEFS